MYLQNVRLENIKCFENLELDFIRRNIKTYQRNGEITMAQVGLNLLTQAASQKAEYSTMILHYLAHPLPDHPPI